MNLWSSIIASASVFVSLAAYAGSNQPMERYRVKNPHAADPITWEQAQEYVRDVALNRCGNGGYKVAGWVLDVLKPNDGSGQGRFECQVLDGELKALPYYFEFRVIGNEIEYGLATLEPMHFEVIGQ